MDLKKNILKYDDMPLSQEEVVEEMPLNIIKDFFSSCCKPY
jgi:hypothetical protein